MTYQLHFMFGRGRAETIRLLFAAANVEYEDVRYTREEWATKKATIPGGKVPYLKTPEGKGLVQSMAIARYLAIKFNLYPKELDDIYLVERALSQMSDLYDQMFKYHLSPAEKKDEFAREFVEKSGKELLQTLSGFLEEHSHCGFTAENLTLAELHYINLHDYLTQFFPTLIAQFPRLQKIVDYVKTHNEGVAKWLVKRPVTPI